MTNLFKITGTVTLKKGAGRQLKSGGMWVYDNEIDTFSETVEDGGLIELHDFDDYFMGIGFVNRRSKITVRMLSRHEGEINEEFIKQRVKDAVSYRMDTVDTSSCRLIFGEADFLPGIVIDKFSDVLVVESLALGIDRFKQLIGDDLKEILKEYHFGFSNGKWRKKIKANRYLYEKEVIEAVLPKGLGIKVGIEYE